jgi:hypothetical protein
VFPERTNALFGFPNREQSVVVEAEIEAQVVDDDGEKNGENQVSGNSPEIVPVFDERTGDHLLWRCRSQRSDGDWVFQSSGSEITESRVFSDE